MLKHALFPLPSVYLVVYLNLILIITLLLSSSSLSMSANQDINLKPPWKLGIYRYSYRVFIGGIEIADVNIKYYFDQQGYSIISTLLGKGLLHSLIGVKAELKSDGRWIRGNIQPQMFESKSQWHGVDTTISINFIEGKEPQFTYISENNLFIKEHFPKNFLLGVIDPSSLFLIIANKVNKNGSCNLQTRVFTGRHLIKICSVDKGITTLPKNNIFDTLKEVQLCEISMQRIRVNDDLNHIRNSKKIITKFYLSHNQSATPTYPLLINTHYRGLNSKTWLHTFRFTEHIN